MDSVVSPPEVAKAVNIAERPFKFLPQRSKNCGFFVVFLNQRVQKHLAFNNELNPNVPVLQLRISYR